MTESIQGQGCHVLEVASTPTFADTIDRDLCPDPDQWAALEGLELEMCARPKLLGMGLHLLFVARKTGW